MPKMTPVLFVASVLVLGSPIGSGAVPLPPVQAEADAAAHYQDSAVPSLPVVDPVFADQFAIVPGPGQGNFAISDGTGVTSDPLLPPKVDGFSEVQAFLSFEDQTTQSIEATSLGRIVTRWVASPQTGGGPPDPIDVDITLNLDGALEILASLLGESAEVGFVATLHDASGPTTIFDGTARLEGCFVLCGNELTTTGDLAVGDFASVAPVGLGTARYELDLERTIDDALLVSPGAPFAVELELTTRAFASAVFEIRALSDFSGTGLFSLSSDTGGVVFTAVPEPLALPWLSVVLLLARRRHRSAGDRPPTPT